MRTPHIVSSITESHSLMLTLVTDRLRTAAFTNSTLVHTTLCVTMKKTRQFHI